MNKNSLIKLRNFIKKETTEQHTKQIIPGNVRLSLGMYRTEVEQKKYIEKQDKKYRKQSQKEEKQYKKYIEKLAEKK